jgi:hypothetical protein
MAEKQWLFNNRPVDPWFGREASDTEVSKPLELPQTTGNEVIGIVFGTANITRPYIAWWGDLKIQKVKPSAAGKK